MFNAEAAYDELKGPFQGRVQRNESLASHSAFGVGGPADVWVVLKTREELMDLVRLCAERQWPVLLVGNGSNVLYADAGVQGIVARIALSSYTIENEGKETALLLADAGVSWPSLVHELAPLGWGGLDFGVGIPGTLGGAVISNAGAHNSELGQVLEWIEVLDARGCNAQEEEVLSIPLLRRYLHDELDLSYRHSRFREQHQTRFDGQGRLIPASRGRIEPAEIVMRLAIQLHREEPASLQAKLAQYRVFRRMSEPPERHAGSIFKDAPRDSAGHLIEESGMKGSMQGKAQISMRNANYIVNLGGAKASDIAALIMQAHTRVLEQFGVNLELDVELRGEWQGE